MHQIKGLHGFGQIFHGLMFYLRRTIQASWTTSITLLFQYTILKKHQITHSFEFFEFINYSSSIPSFFL